MLNTRQITFLFIFLHYIDRLFEKSLKTRLWLFWGTTVSESSEIGSTAPNSIIDIIESGRVSLWTLSLVKMEMC